MTSPCGECPECIDRELEHLEVVELLAWELARGDLTAYLERMAYVMDEFGANGLD